MLEPFLKTLSACRRARQIVLLVGVRAVSALGLDREIDLRSVDRHVRRGLDAEAHLCAVVRQHPDLDLVPDHDALFGLPRQDEHEPRLPDSIQLVRTPSPRRAHRTDTRHIDSLCGVIIPYELSAEMTIGSRKARKYT